MRRRGGRADWVYRANTQIAADNVPDFIGTSDTYGTYEPVLTTLGPGAVNAIGKWLYDSHNWLRTVAGSQAGPVAGNQRVSFLHRAARAEGKKALILGVQGHIFVSPTTWAVGSAFAIGVRIGAFEQDPVQGALSLDANYSLWQVVGTSNPADWANSRDWVWETRRDHQFSDNQSFIRIPIRIRCRKWLMPYQGMGVLMETEASSTNVVIQCWLRTLVADEG